MCDTMSGQRCSRKSRRSALRSRSAAPDHHQPFLLEGPVGLGDGERIGPEIGGEAAHRRQRIAVADPAFEDHRGDGVAQAEIDRAFFGHCVMLD